MQKASQYSQNIHPSLLTELGSVFKTIQGNNERLCPSCDLLTLQGMPGGRDSVCKNCGYKDPCCYD